MNASPHGHATRTTRTPNKNGTVHKVEQGHDNNFDNT
jgi:hypothetical protein